MHIWPTPRARNFEPNEYKKLTKWLKKNVSSCSLLVQNFKPFEIWYDLFFHQIQLMKGNMFFFAQLKKISNMILCIPFVFLYKEL